MAVTVDGVKKDTMPSGPEGKDGQYYEVKVSCGSSETEGEWDYNAWRLNLDYIESNSKCNLEFTSSMTKDQYDEYIQTGVALRRNTYRGKDITDLWSTGELYKQISNGTFADIYVGDYIKTSNNGHDVTWLIADLDNFFNTFNLSAHHATIIPALSLFKDKMNDKATTGVVYSTLKLTTLDNEEHTGIGGYMGSKMKQETLGQVLNDYILPIFGDYVFSLDKYLGDQVDLESHSSIYGKNGITSRNGSYKSKIDLMSEVNVFGTSFYSSSVYDYPGNQQQFALFRLKPEFIWSDGHKTRTGYWLSAVASSTNFVYVSDVGYAANTTADNSIIGVRPYFIIL